MQSKIEHYISDKNAWLSKQVDVEFPTPESLLGRQLYLEAEQEKEYTSSSLDILMKGDKCFDIIEVDFHRLTILFAVLRAVEWSDNPEKERLIIEFLTQIILDENYQFYLGFWEGEVAAGLIAHLDQNNKIAVLTDIIVDNNNEKTLTKQRFISDVLAVLSEKSCVIHDVIYPA